VNGWKVASLAEPTLALERLADLGPLRGDWTRLAERAENVFGTWEWADAWNRHLGAGARLDLGVARAADGGVVAILPLFEARRTPFRLLRFLGAGPSDQLGPICAPEDRWTAAKAMARFLASALRGGGIFIGERVLGTEGLGGQLGECFCAAGLRRCCRSAAEASTTSWAHAAATSASRCAGESAESPVNTDSCTG